MRKPNNTDIAAYLPTVIDAPVLEPDLSQWIGPELPYLYTTTVDGSEAQALVPDLRRAGIELKIACDFLATKLPVTAEEITEHRLIPVSDAAREAARRWKPAFTPALLAEVLAMELDDTRLSDATNAELDALSARLPYAPQEPGWRSGMQASFDGLNGLAFEVLSQGHASLSAQDAGVLLRAYRELGVSVDGMAGRADLLALLDAFDGLELGGDDERKLTTYGIAFAIAAGDPGTALTIADGRSGAGIGWDLTREELGADLAAENDART